MVSERGDGLDLFEKIGSSVDTKAMVKKALKGGTCKTPLPRPECETVLSPRLPSISELKIPKLPKKLPKDKLSHCDDKEYRTVQRSVEKSSIGLQVKFHVGKRSNKNISPKDIVATVNAALFG